MLQRWQHENEVYFVVWIWCSKITNEVQRGIHFPAISKRGSQAQPSLRSLKDVKKRGDFCSLCTPGYSSLRLEYSLRASEYSLLVARERHAKGRRESEKHAPLRSFSSGQLRSPEMESLPAGYAYSFSLCTGYLCTARPRIACLLALSSHLENIISDSLFEIFFIKLGGEGKPPPWLASQASQFTRELLGLFSFNTF